MKTAVEKRRKKLQWPLLLKLLSSNNFLLLFFSSWSLFFFLIIFHRNYISFWIYIFLVKVNLRENCQIRHNNTYCIMEQSKCNLNIYIFFLFFNYGRIPTYSRLLTICIVSSRCKRVGSNIITLSQKWSLVLGNKLTNNKYKTVDSEK